MSVYHQMGHHSYNLLEEPGLGAYRGAILSPVDYPEEEIGRQISARGSDQFEMTFDPQLYFPRSQRRNLPSWPYFPRDFDTADLSSMSWWEDLTRRIVETTGRISPQALCSPAVVPRVYSAQYYALSRDVSNALVRELDKSGVAVLQTVLARLDDLSQEERPPELASIVSAGAAKRVYLVFVSDVTPRRELVDTENLKGAMRLIRHLEEAGLQVLVGFASSDVVLWKYAGSTSCATGKFFNLRRFTASRFEPPPDGGGQVPYWFEESLMAFLRESDLIRVRSAEMLSSASAANPYSADILGKLDNPNADAREAWLADSWRHYMYWFADFESRVSRGDVDVRDHLRSADTAWRALDQRDIFMEERANDGNWIRPWRRAVAEAFQ